MCVCVCVPADPYLAEQMVFRWNRGVLRLVSTQIESSYHEDIDAILTNKERLLCSLPFSYFI